MNDFYNPTLGSKIWIFLIHIQQLCSEVIKDDQLILNNIFKKQNIIAIIPPLLFKSCDWAIIKLSEVGHVRALEIGQGCGCADTPPTPTPDSSRGWHRDHSSSIFLSSSSSFLPHLPFFFIFPALSKQSGLGPLSRQAVDMTALSAVLTATCQTAENVTLGWSETNRLLRRQWERLWLLSASVRTWVTAGDLLTV